MNIAARKKIAIIGSGISGLGAASLLYQHHDITVFEKNDYIGGHSRTVDVTTSDGIVPVDMGFIVFNKRNYPLLTRLFQHLEVPIVKSDMSFGASIDNGWLEYGMQGLGHIFAQKKNLLRPAFWRMLIDILKFNRSAKPYLSKDPSFTLGDCLKELKFGVWFNKYFILAMGGAIWSSPVSEMLKFPASRFVRFFENHGILTLNNRPQWYTIRGGSREYVRRISDPFKDHVHLNRGVTNVWRDGAGVIVEDVRGHQEIYDDVIFACHADQALAMISDLTEDSQKILSSFRYQPNRCVLHSDISFMPKNRKAWASWIYLSESKEDQTSCVSLSYWMNNLQPLQTDQPLIVTLNPGREPDPDLIYYDFIFEHPIFDVEAICSQDKMELIQGQNHLWFCGAYQCYGFHEDGLRSAVNLVKRMGIEPTW